MFTQAFLPAAARMVHRNAAHAPGTVGGVEQKRSDGFFIVRGDEAAKLIFPEHLLPPPL